MKGELSAESFHLYLSGAPWLRLLLPFGGGIAIAMVIPPGSAFFFEEMYALLGFLLLGYLLSLYEKNGLGLRKWIPGGLAMLFLCCAGFQLTRAAISLHASNHFSKHNSYHLLVQVHTIPEKRGKYFRFVARVLYRTPNEKPWEPADRKPRREAEDTPGITNSGIASPGIASGGLLLVYLQPKDGPVPVYGDRLWIRATFREVPPPGNPAAFDYQAYLAARDIYHQVFLSAKEWTGTGENRGNPLISSAADIQQRCAGIFERLIPDRDNAALLSAFVLGYRTGISAETVSNFAATGTIHILSVSGLHVAILYWLVNLLLKPLALLRGGKALQLVLTICIILCYALVTGGSPPVCRAGWMLILLVLARYLGKSYRSENMLALTAFLLLANNPLLLADVGFQLSFLAVAGLIYLYPPLNRLGFPGRKDRRRKVSLPPLRTVSRFRCFGCLHVLYRLRIFHHFRRLVGRLGSALLKTIWSMTAVSLAAQLATFPLSVYYFHQFPVYFLPANLLLIPLSSLILYGGILLLLLPGSSGATLLLAGQVSGLLDIMKQTMHFFGELPGAVLDGIWITSFQSISLFVVLIAGALFLGYRKAGCLLVLLGALCYLAAEMAFENYRQLRQGRMIFFQLKDQAAVAFLAGRSAVLIMEKDKDRQQYDYAVAPFLNRAGIEDIQILRPDQAARTPYLVKEGSYIKFFGLRLLLIDDNFLYPPDTAEVLPCDLLLITENTYLQTDKIERNFRVRMLVSGANISRALDNYLERFCRRKNIAFYSIGRSGAFILNRVRQYEF